MENFTLQIENEEFNIIPLEEKDQVLYEVHKTGSHDIICLIGLNEEAQWEANCDYPAEIVKKIGDAIEHHES